MRGSSNLLPNHPWPRNLAILPSVERLRTKQSLGWLRRRKEKRLAVAQGVHKEKKLTWFTFDLPGYRIAHHSDHKATVPPERIQPTDIR